MAHAHAQHWLNHVHLWPGHNLQGNKGPNLYATATLSGDVASALSLLKRLTKPASRKAQRGLLIPLDELASCEVSHPVDVINHWVFFSSVAFLMCQGL